MSFAYPLGLLGLLAVPAVLALHLFRRRLPQRRIAGLFLWHAAGLEARAGRKRTRLLRSKSLWLELLIAMALGLWLAGPRIGSGATVVHEVLVLDDSASMDATPDGDSVLAAARASIEARLDDLPGDALVTVITTGARPVVLAGPKVPVPDARRSIESWQPRRVSHDPKLAFDLAFGVAGPGDRVVFLTDTFPRAEDAIDTQIEVEAFGRSAPNAAIAAIQARGRRLFVDVQSYGAIDPQARLEIRRATNNAPDAEPSETEPLEIVQFDLKADRVSRLGIDLPPTPGDLEVTVRARGDALAVDDTVLLLDQPDRVVRIAVDPQLSEQTGLSFDRVVEALGSCRLVDDFGAAELCVVPADGVDRVPASSHSLVFEPTDGEIDSWVGPYLIDRQSRLTDGLSLGGVVWTAARQAPNGRPLIRIGERVLMTSEQDSADRIRVRLNLDPKRTNLTKSPDWPILLDNLVRFVRSAAPGPVDLHPPVSGQIAFRRSAAQRDSELVLVDPDGTRRRGRAANLVDWDARSPGLHELQIDGKPAHRFAPRFVDPIESDLRDASTGLRDAAPTDTAEESARQERGRLERKILALLALLCLGLDWWVLRRER